jgi:polyphosphate kinase 2 (PPK2 family)
MLTQSGITILKYYLDISKTEQANRLIDRSTNPLKQWKISPIDLVAQKKWVEYSLARDNMLKYTNHPDAPWTLICADNKKLTHINLISHLLTKLDYPKKNHKILTYDPKIILDL